MRRKSPRSLAVLSRATALVVPLLSGVASTRGAAFASPDNLVVVRCTNGQVGGAERVFLDEYDVSGASPSLVQTIDLPSTGSDAFTLPNIGSHDRHLHRSTDGRYLSLAGYDMPYVAGGMTDPSAEPVASTRRVVALVKFDGTLDLSTKLTDAFDGTGVRGAFTTDGNKIWLSGDNLSGATYTGGIRFTTRGSSTTNNLSQVQGPGGTQTADNIRDAAIFAGQLYECSGSNASVGKGLLKVGTGMPENGSQPASLLTTDGISVSSFSFLDANPAVPGLDTVYTATSSPGTLRKYNLVGGAWTAAGAISSGGFDVEDVVTKLDSSGHATIFTHTKSGSIYRLTDSTPYGAALAGSLGSPFITAQTGFDLGGLDFAPVSPVSTWNVDASGDWPVAGNWLGPVPNAVDWTAVFGPKITAPRTVTLTSAQTVGTIVFNNASRYTLAGTGTVVLDVASGNAAIDVTLGSHRMDAPLVLNKPTTVTVASNAALTISNLQTATVGLTKSGPGTLELTRARLGSLSINSGTVTITPAAGNASSLALLSVSPGATLDLNDNDLVTGTGKSTVENFVKAARNAGAWNQSGITSSAARSNASTGLGVLSGAEYTSVGGTGTFSGQTYGAGDTLVKYTWNGDANFDGRVTFDDYVKIDTGFNTGLTGWLNGDFNLSGAVNFDDYVLIDIAFNQQNGTLSRAIDWISGDDRTKSGSAPAPGVQIVMDHFEQFGAGYGAALLASVPEPGVAVMLGLAGAGFTLFARSRFRPPRSGQEGLRKCDSGKCN